MKIKKLITLTITPNQFSVDEHLLSSLKILNKKRPLYVIFKDWDLLIKNIDLSKMSFLDRYYARKEFIKREIKSVFCSQVSKEHVHWFYTFKDKEGFQEKVKALSSLPNPIYKIEIDELLWIQKTNQLHSPTGWYFLIFNHEEPYKILVGYKSNLVFVRKNIHNLETELKDIKLYLYRFGLRKNEDIQIYNASSLEINIKRSFKLNLFNKPLSLHSVWLHKLTYKVNHYGFSTALFISLILLSITFIYKNTTPTFKMIQEIDQRYIEAYNPHIIDFKLQKDIVHLAKPFFELSQISKQNNLIEIYFTSKTSKKEFTSHKNQLQTKLQKKHQKIKISGEYPQIKVFYGS